MVVAVAAAGLIAQTADPDYVIPKENPYATLADLQAGGKVFLGQCAGCHGPRGEGGRGAVLAQPRLRHSQDDESLFRVIRDGINGTDMPTFDTLTTRETWQLAAYVRSLGRVPTPTPIPGDAQRGREIFRLKGNCAQCHIVDGEGGSLGPELTEIGARRNAEHLRAVVLDPLTKLPEGFLQVRVWTKDGLRITGVRLNEDTFTIQIRGLNGQLYSFLKQDIKDLQKDTGQTPMPSVRALLSAAETDYLVAYLVSLKGKL